LSEVTIVSLADYVTADYQHELGKVYIPAKQPDEPYVKVVVTDRITAKDFGEGRKEVITIPAKDFAEDIVGVYKDENLLKRGVFIAAGNEPTEKEIAAARKQMEAYYRLEIREADSAWSRKQDRKQISDRAVTAANYFHLRKEWAADMTSMAPCAACKELVAADAVRCPHCHAILDQAKAAQFWPELYNKPTGATVALATVATDAPVKRGPGRPRKQVDG
jgi:hypothetical protein